MVAAQPVGGSVADSITSTGPSPVLPPGPHLPAFVQGLGFVTRRRQTLAAFARRYGPAFTLRIPLFGKVVVIADPTMAKQLFTTPTDQVVNVRPNLG
ncbi:cytochrome P450, partial [Streptomyces sp. SID10244]|nr:cytochrome P450 [Streptomyces sp. SID10244]